jgi:hypothetical protein
MTRSGARGILHLCHAPDAESTGLCGEPISNRRQLIKMPTVPLIRLELAIQDRPEDPYRFESFLKVADEKQAYFLAGLANQDQLHLAFYGDDLAYCSSTFITHRKQQWQQLDEIVAESGRQTQHHQPVMLTRGLGVGNIPGEPANGGYGVSRSHLLLVAR